jgi:hypothetical protein
MNHLRVLDVDLRILLKWILKDKIISDWFPYEAGNFLTKCATTVPIFRRFKIRFNEILQNLPQCTSVCLLKKLSNHNELVCVCVCVCYISHSYLITPTKLGDDINQET